MYVYARHWQGRNRLGVEVTVSGYSHKLPKLLECVLDTLTSGDIDPARFALVKEGMQKSYENALLKPQMHCTYQRCGRFSGGAVSLLALCVIGVCVFV